MVNTQNAGLQEGQATGSTYQIDNPGGKSSSHNYIAKTLQDLLGGQQTIRADGDVNMDHTSVYKHAEAPTTSSEESTSPPTDKDTFNNSKDIWMQKRVAHLPNNGSGKICA